MAERNPPKKMKPDKNTTTMPTTLEDLIRQVDPDEKLDKETEDALLQMADNFIDNAITAACIFAKHRNSPSIDVNDLQLHLERHWNMWLPGFGTDKVCPRKRTSVSDAHEQRLKVIKKALKKSEKEDGKPG